MKKTVTTLVLALVALIGSSAFVIQSSTGIHGYTGSPGEGTCSNCHGGGISATSGITITSLPAFSVNANSETEYMPDSTYQITIEVSAAGFTRYGFSSQILNASHVNAGVLQNAGPGVKFLNAGAKRTATHTTPKIQNAIGTFTYKWVAPASGDATIYAIGNAVNGNNQTSGDFVVAPASMALVAAPPPPAPTETVGLKENVTNVSQISVFPNPSHGLSNISYFLKSASKIDIELIDIRGSVIKHLHSEHETPGFHSQILDLHGVPSGVYFIKTSSDQQKISQKLITVQ